MKGVVNCAVAEGKPGSIDGVACDDATTRERLKYVEFPMCDGASGAAGAWLDPAADAVASLIESGATPLLVHCSAGKSRSAAVVIAYLVKHDGMSLRQALILTRAKRHRAYPRAQFFEALMGWEPTVRPGRTPACSLPPAALARHAENAAAGSSETAKVARLSEALAVGEAVALAALQAAEFDLERATAQLMVRAEVD
jgi:hypothetical protein